MKRVPAIGEAGVQSTVCGPESFTPDHKPLLGEVWIIQNMILTCSFRHTCMAGFIRTQTPELRGFFLGCGFNSAGIMLAGVALAKTRLATAVSRL